MFTLEQGAASPIAVENVYHVAYRVPSLRAAMAALSRSLGATWATPFEAESQFEKPGGGIEAPHLRIAYSLQGPPFIELIEYVGGAPGSIFADAPDGVHHIGFYAERWRDETARLVDLGFIHELSGAGLAFVRDPALGVRYEVVSFRGRGFLTDILSGAVGRMRPLREGA